MAPKLLRRGLSTASAYRGVVEKIALLDAQLNTELDRLHAARVAEDPDRCTRARVAAKKLEKQLELLVAQARELHRRHWLGVAAEVRPQFRQLVEPIGVYRRAMDAAGERVFLGSLIASLVADSTNIMESLGDGEIPPAAPDAPALDRAEEEIY
jgi:hypothetical protein